MEKQKTTKIDPQATDSKREKVRVIPINCFVDFPGHPFKVQMDDEMIALIESVKNFGIINPLLARKTNDEKYEIVAGRRRKFAALKVGLETLPVMLYPTGSAITQLNREKISELLKEIKEFDTEYRHGENDHEHLNRIVTWYSRRLTQGLDSEKGAEGCRCRVALSDNILRAYFSLCGYTNCICDCTCIGVYRGQSNQQIRGPCKSVNLLNYKKEYFSYGYIGQIMSYSVDHKAFRRCIKTLLQSGDFIEVK